MSATDERSDVERLQRFRLERNGICPTKLGMRFDDGGIWVLWREADVIASKLSTAEAERDEAERLLRLAYAMVSNEDAGYQSLKHLRKDHSPELADIAIAFDLSIASLRAEQDTARERIVEQEVAARELGDKWRKMVDVREDELTTLRARVEELEKFTRFFSRNKGSHTAMAIELLERLEPTPDTGEEG